MKKLKFILAGILLLSGIVSIIKGITIAGIFIILLAALTLPPISESLKSNIKAWQLKSTRYVTYAVILVLVGATKKPDTNETKTNVKTDQEALPSKYNKEKKVLTDMEKDHSDFWKKFDPIVKERVYKLIEKKDCAGLQNEFKITAENLEKIQNSGGDGSRNLGLMNFLDKKMKELDCY